MCSLSLRTTFIDFVGVKVFKRALDHRNFHNYSSLLLSKTPRDLGPVVQSVVSLTSSLRVISLTVLADSIYNIHCKSYSHLFSKNFQHICVSLDVNFNESLTNDIVSFEQLDPDVFVFEIMVA